MIWRSISLVVLVLAGGCTHGVYHDRQTNNPNYFVGRDRPIFYPRLPFRADGKEPDSVPNHPGTDSQETVFGLLASAFTLAENPDYYKKSTIGGRCLYEAPAGSTLEIPCVNVTVLLLDAKGHPVNHHLTHDGTFAFYVEKNKTYSLTVEAGRFHMQPRELGPVAMGDDVVIRLTSREATVGRMD